MRFCLAVCAAKVRVKMTKNDFIAGITRALLMVEASSVKSVSVTYHGFINSLEITVAKNKEAFNQRLWYTRIRLDGDLESEFAKAVAQIELVGKIPDEPVEEMVTVQIPKRLAEEMGVA